MTMSVASRWRIVAALSSVAETRICIPAMANRVTIFSSPSPLHLLSPAVTLAGHRLGS